MGWRPGPEMAVQHLSAASSWTWLPTIFLWISLSVGVHCFGNEAGYPAVPPPESNAGRIGLIEAIETTLRQDLNIQIQQMQVRFAEGAVQNAAGQFDPVLDTAVSRGISHLPLSESQHLQDNISTQITSLNQDTTSFRVGVNTQLRSGVKLGPVVEISRVADSANQQIAANVAQVAFVIQVPLMRGLGRSVVEAPERAARLTAEATVSDLRQVTATRVYNMVAAYWNCRAAELQRKVVKSSASRAKELLESLRLLAKSGEIPTADLDQARADLSEKEADQLSAEQLFLEARHTLALSLGWRIGESDSIPLPAEDFPALPVEFSLPGKARENLVQGSLVRRGDYQSAVKAVEAHEALLVSARDNLKPQLDFNLQAGYTGLEETSQFHGFFGAAVPWVAPGPNVLGTLKLSVPFHNRAARGSLEQRAAAKAQSLMRSEDLARSIAASVRTSVAQLESAYHEAKNLMASQQSYQQALEHEEEKMKLGNSTVIDRITLADRWSNAQVKYIQAQARYATALVRVRYETGLLIPAQASQPAVIRTADLTVPPDLGAVGDSQP